LSDPEDFYTNLATKIAGRRETGKLSDWILEKGIVTPSGVPFEFKAHKFLKDIYDDWTPIQAIPKGSQVGVTECVAIKTIYAAAHRRWNIIYTLPADDHLKQFIPSKLNMIIARNPALSEMVAPGDSMYRKQIGSNFIFYQGTFTEREALMLSADLCVFDERDHAKQDVIKQYQSRLAFSKYQGEWSLSNLTAPGRGVHGLWLKSDQKHWHIKCPRCNYEQTLSWPDSIDVKNEVYVCKKCQKSLPDSAREDGFWVAHETSEISGYWINHLMCSWIPAKKIIANAFEPGGQAYFHNYVLGLPYRGSDETVDRDIILKSRKDKTLQEYTNLPVAIGIDTGLIWHVVVGCEAGIFDMKACSEEEARAMIERYKPMCVIDLKGDTTTTRRLMMENRGRVFGCDYKRDKADREIIKWGKAEKWGVVYVDRNRMIDQVIDDFHREKIPIINRSVESLETFIKHWESLYKIRAPDSMGIEREKWEFHGAQGDHFVHATLYFKVALSRIIRTPAKLKFDQPRFIDRQKKLSLDYVISGGRRKGDIHWTKL